MSLDIMKAQVKSLAKHDVESGYDPFDSVINAVLHFCDGLRKNTVKFKKLSPEASIPTQAYKYDAAVDLRSIDEYSLEDGEIKEVHTGLAMELPNNMRAILKEKSGLAKKGVSIRGGVIDAGYRGELIVIVKNETGGRLIIEPLTKIAQMKFEFVPEVSIIEVEELQPSERGDKGFGSSGV